MDGSYALVSAVAEGHRGGGERVIIVVFRGLFPSAFGIRKFVVRYGRAKSQSFAKQLQGSSRRFFVCVARF